MNELNDCFWDHSLETKQKIKVYYLELLLKVLIRYVIGSLSSKGLQT